MTGINGINPIPDFDGNGNLPQGVHKVTLCDIKEKLTWSQTRKQLFEGLEQVIVNFRNAGIKEVFIDGSFTTVKDDPNDIDGCWIPNKDVDINVLDPVFLDRNPPRQKMKDKYGVDFLIAGVDCGRTKTQPILELFSVDRNGYSKGILLVEL